MEALPEGGGQTTLREVVGRLGFATLASFAETGDRVLRAWWAIGAEAGAATNWGQKTRDEFLCDRDPKQAGHGRPVERQDYEAAREEYLARGDGDDVDALGVGVGIRLWF